VENKIKAFDIDGWHFRKRVPAGAGHYPVLLLLHGWTGDEDVMWVFAGRLANLYLMIAPRGLYPTPQGGYGWHPSEVGDRPTYLDFKPAADKLLKLLTPANFPEADFNRLYIMGFSQGAALTYTLALLYPNRVTAFTGLSGYLPGEISSLIAGRPLEGKRAFIAHGTKDELVAVERARQAVKLLEQAGARVTFCEDNVGHRLSLNCFRAMEDFLKH
jgi:phospholipase/carboxylesterase